MAIQTIKESEIATASVASLPSRPNAQPQFGGRGYTAKELKEAFDRLPRLIVERLNALIESLYSGEMLQEVTVPLLDTNLVDYLSQVEARLQATTEGMEDCIKMADLVDDVGDQYEGPVTSRAVYGAITTLLSDIEDTWGSVLPYLKKMESLHLTCDEDYTLRLMDETGNVYGEGIDLPMESVIVGADYAEDRKEVVFTLQNGNTLSVGLTELLEGLVTEGRLQNALAEKQDLLIFDEEPTWESTNPVTSAGVYDALVSLEEYTDERCNYIEEEYVSKEGLREQLGEVYTILGQTILVEETDETYETSRKTGGDLAVLDGVSCKLHTVWGRYEESPSDFVPGSFEGYVSTGVNVTELAPTQWYAHVSDGYSLQVSKDPPDENVVLARMIAPDGNENLIDYLIDGETYQYMQYPYYITRPTSGAYQLHLVIEEADGTRKTTVLYSARQSFTVDKSTNVGYYLEVQALNPEKGVAWKTCTFSLCLASAGVTHPQPYVNGGFVLDEPITLGEFDRIDFENGQAIIAGGVERKDTPYTEEELAERYFDEYYVSEDGTCIAYCLEDEAECRDIDNLPTSYVAYVNGHEAALPLGQSARQIKSYYTKAGCIQ